MTDPAFAPTLPAQEFVFGMAAAPLFAAFLIREHLKFECSTWERKGRVYFSEIDPADEAQRLRLVQFARMIGTDFLEINRERLTG